MVSQSLVKLALFCIVGLAGISGIAAEELEKSPRNHPNPHTLHTFTLPADWGGGKIPNTVLRHREARTEKGLSQPPRKLLDQFPMLFVGPDANGNYTGVLVDVDSGTSYSMPQLDKELFDQNGEPSGTRFHYDKNLHEELRITPEGNLVNPDGDIYHFRDYIEEQLFDQDRKPSLQRFLYDKNRLEQLRRSPEGNLDFLDGVTRFFHHEPRVPQLRPAPPTTIQPKMEVEPEVLPDVDH